MSWSGRKNESKLPMDDVNTQIEVFASLLESWNEEGLEIFMDKEFGRYLSDLCLWSFEVVKERWDYTVSVKCEFTNPLTGETETVFKSSGSEHPITEGMFVAMAESLTVGVSLAIHECVRVVTRSIMFTDYEAFSDLGDCLFHRMKKVID